MPLRNLRIGLRASLSFAVLASLLVLVGLFGIGQMATLRESARVLEEVWMPSSESIHDSAANIATIRLESLRMRTSNLSQVKETSRGIHQRSTPGIAPAPQRLRSPAVQRSGTEHARQPEDRLSPSTCHSSTRLLSTSTPAMTARHTITSTSK